MESKKVFVAWYLLAKQNVQDKKFCFDEPCQISITGVTSHFTVTEASLRKQQSSTLKMTKRKINNPQIMPNFNVVSSLYTYCVDHQYLNITYNHSSQIILSLVVCNLNTILLLHYLWLEYCFALVILHYSSLCISKNIVSWCNIWCMNRKENKIESIFSR